MFYSKIEVCFYPAEYPADDLPADAVELSDSEYLSLLSAKFYATSTSGFYSIEMHGKSIPGDAVEITDAEYLSLLDGQSTGLLISADPEGRPILVERPPKSKEELSAAALSKRDSLLATAAVRIAPLQDAADLGRSTPEKAALLKKWKEYRVDVDDVPSQSGFPHNIAWPDQPI
ncbi:MULTISPECIES: tail fiber assembly protein [Pseudomonas]|uniref:tail fiber assembly protein n=1 Tax=Pseudomonas TaxID=286 RepID=UPI000CFB011A|nr:MULTISPECIES: tail fiber assembly protein [Pseudomonas]PQZ87674.1 phage tail protein [Pseudomonas trivialis]PRB23608.1 phage tail protein [Pseudomonas sp. MYb60]